MIDFLMKHANIYMFIFNRSKKFDKVLPNSFYSTDFDAFFVKKHHGSFIINQIQPSH